MPEGQNSLWISHGYVVEHPCPPLHTLPPQQLAFPPLLRL